MAVATVTCFTCREPLESRREVDAHRRKHDREAAVNRFQNRHPSGRRAHLKVVE